jgi:GAF domain-containing protein
MREIEIRMSRGGDLVADLGNVAAVLKKRLGYYWTGFYLLHGDRLVLGPFQGTPACVFLKAGEGVCWACVQALQTIIVPDVRHYPGHVECDPRSRSEIAVPVFDTGGAIRAVLDLDDDHPASFDETDRENLEAIEKKIRILWNLRPHDRCGA